MHKQVTLYDENFQFFQHIGYIFYYYMVIVMTSYDKHKSQVPLTGAKTLVYI